MFGEENVRVVKPKGNIRNINKTSNKNTEPFVRQNLLKIEKIKIC